MRRQRRNAAPTMSKGADTSPMRPDTYPTRMSNEPPARAAWNSDSTCEFSQDTILPSRLLKTYPWLASISSGLPTAPGAESAERKASRGGTTAVLTEASPTTAHRVIALLHERRANTTPPSAGFIQFRPSPPKLCLTTRMPKAAAAAGTYRGAPAGIRSPTSSPVRSALPSASVNRRNRAEEASSAATATQIEVAITRTAGSPKRNTPHTAAGTRDRLTSHVIHAVEVGAPKCGAGDKVSLPRARDLLVSAIARTP